MNFEVRTTPSGDSYILDKEKKMVLTASHFTDLIDETEAKKYLDKIVKSLNKSESSK